MQILFSGELSYLLKVIAQRLIFEVVGEDDSTPFDNGPSCKQDSTIATAISLYIDYSYTHGENHRGLAQGEIRCRVRLSATVSSCFILDNAKEPSRR